MSEYSKKLMALTITILMLGSSLAYLFYSFFSGPEEEYLPVIQDLNTDTAYFQALEVPATIKSVNPSVLLFADTAETNIDLINSDLKKLEGFALTNASFRPGPENLMYLAELAVKNGSPQEAISFLEKNLPAKLFNPSFTLIGSVEPLGDVSLTNMDSQEEKAYSFSEPLKVFLNPGTIQGDEITATMYVTFKGPLPIEVNLIESVNLSSEPLYDSRTGFFEVASLDSSLMLSGLVDSSDYIDSNSLNSALLRIPGITESALDVSPQNFLLYLSSNESRDFSDLNSFLYSLQGKVENVSLSPFYASLSFSSIEELSSAKSAISSQALSLGLNLEVEESVSFVEGTLYFAGSDSNSAPGSTVSSIESVLSSHRIDYDLFQPGTLYLGELSDSNLSFDSNSFPAMLLPGHSVGDKALIEAKYFYSRNDAMVYDAVEEAQ